MKRIISLLAVLVALTLTLSLTPASFAAETAVEAPEASAPTVADAFTGEILTYKIGFWFFAEVGQGTISLIKEEDGTYTGTLEAHTTGSVRRFILDRTDKYVSHMRLSDDGQRLVTERFEEFMTMRGKVRKKERLFDYENNRMTWKSWDKRGKESGGEETYPGEITPSDPIAAFYNFRFGSYGDVEHGGEYLIHAMPKNGKVPHITIKIATTEEAGNRNGNRPANTEYLADARIDKDLFGSTSGDMEIYFTGEMVPEKVVAKDLIFFGDVRGSLMRSQRADSVRLMASDGEAAPAP